MLEIIPYQAEYQPDFEKLNKDWISTYFEVEPIDEYVLSQPEEAILNHGGKILFARHQNKIVGTVALRNLGEGIMEFTKMAVDPNSQGLGAGKLLYQSAIDLAKTLKAKKLVLYCHSKLSAALSVYRKHGFVDLPIDGNKYKRADVYMELTL